METAGHETAVAAVEAVARRLLATIPDPELGVDIVELGLVRAVDVEPGRIHVRYTVTTPACPLTRYFEDRIVQVLSAMPGDPVVTASCEMTPPWSPDEIGDLGRRFLGMP